MTVIEKVQLILIKGRRELISSRIGMLFVVTGLEILNFESRIRRKSLTINENV